MLTIGYDHLKKISLLSLTQPVLILAAFHLFLGSALQITFITYMTNFVVLIFAAVLLMAVLLVAEFLMNANVRNVFNLTAFIRHFREKS